MIEMNVVLRDIGQLIRRKIELRGVDVGPHGASNRRHCHRPTTALGRSYGEDPAGNIGFRVIERG